jgi:putative transposase
MPMPVQKAFKYRFYPTDSQARQLAQTFGCARLVWNWGLEMRSQAYEQEKKFLSYADTTAALAQLKKTPEKAFLNDVSSVVLQQSLRNLDAAFNNFFDKRAAYPKFKSRRDNQSARYTSSGFTYRNGQIKLAKQDEPLNISWSRPLPDDARLMNVTVSKDRAERYFISILVKTEIHPLPPVEAEVGIDVGVKTLATCSNGVKLENPRPLQKATRRLRLKQRRLSRKVKGSNNRNKERIKVAKQHARIRDIRADILHQFTTKTIRENQTVFVEGSNVAGMLKNNKLAKQIGDASFAELFRQLEYKAIWYGREIVQLNRFFPSSKLCSNCGYLLPELPLSVREWTCPECHADHERDENASRVILLAGRYLRATGSDARKVDAYEIRAAIGHSA